MHTMTTLKTALLDLLQAIGDPDFCPLIGGGYGIYLKLQLVLAEGNRTLLEEIPEARSTNDIDMFLRTELLTDGERLAPLKQAFEDLGYQAVDGAKFYQFAKPGPRGGKAGSLKVDLLAGPRDLLRACGLKADERRVRSNNPKIKELHAHPVDEAPTVEMECRTLSIEGLLSSGEAGTAKVMLPHPFSFAMMKLFALRDRIEDQTKGFGCHHALDLYTTLAMTNEDEWFKCIDLRDHLADNIFMKEARTITHELFGDKNALGMIRLKEHPYYTPNLQADKFREALLELFPMCK